MALSNPKALLLFAVLPRAKAQRRVDARSGVCFLVLAGALAADNAF